jgi:hypothetical protein
MAYPFYGFLPFLKGLAPIGYAAFFIQAIHNFRLYLSPDNAVMITPLPLSLMIGFPLYDPGVDPTFYDWKGQLLE